MNSNKMQLKHDSTLITGTGKELLQKCMDIMVCVGSGRQTYLAKNIYIHSSSLKDDT